LLHFIVICHTAIDQSEQNLVPELRYDYKKVLKVCDINIGTKK
jgi:hypothetical protein